MKKLPKVFIPIIIMALIPEFASAADLPTMVTKIYQQVKTYLIPIATIVFVGLGIYFVKNLDRWKEIAVYAISIVFSLLILMNADTIANWFANN